MAAMSKLRTKRFQLLGEEKRANLRKTSHLPRHIERTLAQLRIGFENKIGSLNRHINTIGRGKNAVHLRHDSCRWCCEETHQEYNMGRMKLQKAADLELKKRIEARKGTVDSRFRNSEKTRCPDCKTHLCDLRRVHHHLSCFTQNTYKPRHLKHGSKFVVDSNNKFVLQNQCKSPNTIIRTETEIRRILNLKPRGDIFEKYMDAEKNFLQNSDINTPKVGQKTITLEEYKKIKQDPNNKVRTITTKGETRAEVGQKKKADKKKKEENQTLLGQIQQQQHKVQNETDTDSVALKLARDPNPQVKSETLASLESMSREQLQSVLDQKRGRGRPKRQDTQRRLEAARRLEQLKQLTVE